MRQIRRPVVKNTTSMPQSIYDVLAATETIKWGLRNKEAEKIVDIHDACCVYCTTQHGAFYKYVMLIKYLDTSNITCFQIIVMCEMKYQRPANRYIPILMFSITTDAVHSISSAIDEFGINSSINDVSKLVARRIIQSRHGVVSDAFESFTSQWRHGHPITKIVAVSEQPYEYRNMYKSIDDPILEYIET